MTSGEGGSKFGWSVPDFGLGHDYDPSLMMEQVQEDAVSDVASHMLEARESFMRETLEDHDWEEAAIVDFVWVEAWMNSRSLARQSLSDLITEDTRVLVRRYEERAPPMEASAIPGVRCEVQRCTRPVWELAQDLVEDDADQA